MRERERLWCVLALLFILASLFSDVSPQDRISCNTEERSYQKQNTLFLPCVSLLTLCSSDGTTVCSSFLCLLCDMSALFPRNLFLSFCLACVFSRCYKGFVLLSKHCLDSCFSAAYFRRFHFFLSLSSSTILCFHNFRLFCF